MIIKQHACGSCKCLHVFTSGPAVFRVVVTWATTRAIPNNGSASMIPMHNRSWMNTFSFSIFLFHFPLHDSHFEDTIFVSLPPVPGISVGCLSKKISHKEYPH